MFQIKPKPVSYIMAATGLIGNIYVYLAGGDVVATPGEDGAIFRSLYYFMIFPMFLTTLLIYSITKHEEKHGRSKSYRARIYFVSTILALGLTLQSGWRIKDAKEKAGFSFPAAAKKKMERYKTDLFKGRLKKFKDPHPDTSHIPYEEQIKRSNEERREKDKKLLEPKDH
jgi:hypothetical protein